MVDFNSHNDDNYDSASDEDFKPDENAAEGVVDSLSEEAESEGEEPAKNTRHHENDAEDVGFENSGDEATISNSRRKKRKHKDLADFDDEGGEGGLIKTRAQRKQEKLEKRPLANSSSATVDVNALWAQMSTGPNLTAAVDSNKSNVDQESSLLDVEENSGIETPKAAQKQSSDVDTSTTGTAITIKRTYEFAGQKMEEERAVAADSAEARLYLAEQSKKNSSPETGKTSDLRRPMKRKSIFDTTPFSAASQHKTSDPGPKLNTLEKSRLDWAKHVDKEGLSNELDHHRRAKDTYLGRMDFLGRMDAKREDDIRNSAPK